MISSKQMLSTKRNGFSSNGFHQKEKFPLKGRGSTKDVGLVYEVFCKIKRFCKIKWNRSDNLQWK